jgi:hypothetical protein
MRSSNVHRSSWAGGSDRAATLGGARGGLPELSLTLASVAPSRRGLHLRGLQRTGVLTTVFTVPGVALCSSGLGSSPGGGGSSSSVSKRAWLRRSETVQR